MSRYVGKCVIKRMVQNSIDLSCAKIAVLGITFKENCPDIRNSKVVDLVHELESWGVDILIADPWADPDEVKTEYDFDLVDFDRLEDVDSIIVAVGHNEYRSLGATDLKRMVRSEKPVLADIKGLYERESLSKFGFTVFRL